MLQAHRRILSMCRPWSPGKVFMVAGSWSQQRHVMRPAAGLRRLRQAEASAGGHAAGGGGGARGSRRAAARRGGRRRGGGRRSGGR